MNRERLKWIPMKFKGSLGNILKKTFANKLKNVEKWTNFWTHDPPKYDQQDYKKTQRSITSNVTEIVIKNFPTKKSQRADTFTADFYQSYKKLSPILLKLFHKAETSPNASQTTISKITFYEVSTTVLPKLDKGTIKSRTTDQYP